MLHLGYQLENLVIRITASFLFPLRGINSSLPCINYSMLCCLQGWTFWFTYFSFFFSLPFAASTDSPAATVDSETITLNSGTLQTFEILPVSNCCLLLFFFSFQPSYLDYKTMHFKFKRKGRFSSRKKKSSKTYFWKCNPLGLLSKLWIIDKCFKFVLMLWSFPLCLDFFVVKIWHKWDRKSSQQVKVVSVPLFCNL